MRKLLYAVAAVVLIPVLAFAQSLEMRDGNDTKGLMDVSEVVFSDGQVPRWTFLTFSSWTADRVWDRGYVIVNLDTFGTGRFDYYALVRSDGYRLHGELFRDRDRKDDYRVADLKVWRKDRRRVTVKVPLAKLRVGETRLFYRWIGKTLMIGVECPRVCIDRIPDTGSVRALVPGAEPSPTPTAEPTPTVEPSPTVSP